MEESSVKPDCEASTAAGEKPEVSAEKQLPKLTPSEFRQYNRLADHMDQFVNIPFPALNLELQVYKDPEGLDRWAPPL